MEILRQYKNSTEDLIRLDTIYMEAKQDVIATDKSSITYHRILKVQLVHGTGLTDRVVAAIDIIGDYDNIEIYTGNFLWAEWTSPSTIVHMSDLPIVGDTV